MALDTHLLVNGYVKQLIGTFDDALYSDYPDCLNQTISKYLDNVWNVCFDLYPSICKHQIQEDGKTVMRCDTMNKYHPYIICCSHSISKRTHEFSIKCIKPSADAIGIMSHPVKKSIFWAGAQGNLYFYWGGGKISYGVNTINKSSSCSVEPWQQGDIITVRIDCTKWIVTFHKNHKKIEPSIPIIPDIEYHPMMGLQSNNVCYQLVS
eukprot:119432_1